jgi:MFS family permease
MYLLTAPRWVVGLGGGLLVATVAAVVFRFDDPTRSWTAAVLTGVVSGALLGGGLVLSLTMQRGELREAAGELPPPRLSAAYRAAVWGAIPSDPVIRAAAARVAERRLETLRPRILVAIHRDCHGNRHRAARVGRQLQTRGDSGSGGTRLDRRVLSVGPPPATRRTPVGREQLNPERLNLSNDEAVARVTFGPANRDVRPPRAADFV